MTTYSRIEWTEQTWNPVTGCTKLSAGCKYCYAERMAKRLRAMGSERYRDGFKVTLHEDLLDAPTRWRRPRVVFVNSMSDLFHVSVPDRFIYSVFETMARCSQHTFQVLTKRSDRLKQLAPALPWTVNIWMGVSVEDTRQYPRIYDLAGTGANVKFLSCEPLLEALPSLPLDHIHWVIVGGESGPKARPMQKNWATEIRDQCLAADVRYFFKQWGGVNKKLLGRELEGRTWDEMPALAHERFRIAE